VFLASPAAELTWAQFRTLCKAITDYDLAVPSDAYYNTLAAGAMALYGCK